MDYYIEGEPKMGGGYMKHTNKKLINMLTNEITATFDKSEMVAN